MNLFKIFMPKEKIQTATEIESWVLKWYVKTGWHDDTKMQAKVFIKEEEAKEYKRQLEEQSKFIGCWIKTDLSRN